MFEPAIIGRDKFFGADDAGIRKEACAISESIDPADFKFFFALFRDNLIINDPCLHLVRAVQRPGLIYIPAVPSDPLFFAFDTKFFESKIGGQKLVFVFGLQMVSERIPAVFFWPLDKARPQGVYPVK